MSWQDGIKPFINGKTRIMAVHLISPCHDPRVSGLRYNVMSHELSISQSLDFVEVRKMSKSLHLPYPCEIQMI